MDFDKMLKAAVEDIEVPEELSPANIEAMLRAIAPAEEKETENLAEGKRSKIVAKRTNRTVIMRTITAAAACVAIAGGVTMIYEQNTQPEPIESEINYEAVRIQSYDELYNIYTGIYLNSASKPTGAENGDGVEIITDETAIITEMTHDTDTSTTEPEIELTEPYVPETGTDNSETAAELPVVTERITAAQSEAVSVRSDFSDADIVKSDDRSIYYICGGTLYVVNKDNMEVTAEIKNSNSPFELHIRGNALILVSEECASELMYNDKTEKNIVVDIYDTSSGMPEHIKTYKQNGVYSFARVDENGVLYLVTEYSDYRNDPLTENAELDSFVPAYYIDGTKNYVAAEDISVPQGANNTDYTVISSIKCSEPVNVSVKAVLGSSSNSYFAENTLYIASTGVKDNKDFTAITSFDVSENSLAYKAGTVLDGELIGSTSMAETDGIFRIACRSYDDNGMIITNIYSLSSNLEVLSKADHLLAGQIVGSVKFEDNFASLVDRSTGEIALVVDLSQSTPVENETVDSFFASYVKKFNEENMLGISAVKDENGCYTSLKLEMYDISGKSVNEISFAELSNVSSPALSHRKALLIDAETNTIGVPVSGSTEFGVANRYYVFSYSEEGFVQKGMIEYNDISDDYRFERAVINDGMLIIVGSGRIVSVQLSDMTVVDVNDFR